jgi:hypothetical protein
MSWMETTLEPPELARGQLFLKIPSVKRILPHAIKAGRSAGAAR